MPLSTAFALATNGLGQRLDPYMAFNFVVEIEGLIVGGFSEVSGLESNVEVTTYREGGLNRYDHKLPGPTTYANLVLTRGLTDIETLWNWYDNVTRGIIRRKNGTILLLDPQRLPVAWWDFHAAYPVRWVGPQLRAAATEVAVEQLELAHEGLRKPPGGEVLSALRAGTRVVGLR